jgi:VCBS repeat-containing protein
VVEATSSNAGTQTATGTLFVTDVDDAPAFFAKPSTATASGYGSYTMTIGGVWTYTLNNANPMVNGLAAGMFLIDTFEVRAVDGTTQTITVTISGADDVTIVSPATFNGPDPNDFDSLVGSSAPGFLLVNGTNVGETITGDTSSNDKDIINGFGGSDTINAGDATDQVYGGAGSDIINGGDNTDLLYGQADNDTIHGNTVNDDIFGGSGSDVLFGDAGSDQIYGGAGNDTIDGGQGGDTIVGGYGADILTGGDGIDFFVYLSVLDTNDTITDFSGNDRIDLSAIDADSILTGNQDFDWGGNAPIANGLWFTYDSGTNTTTLFGDTDGNAGTAEFMLTLQNFNDWVSNPLNPPVSDITF